MGNLSRNESDFSLDSKKSEKIEIKKMGDTDKIIGIEKFKNKDLENDLKQQKKEGDRGASAKDNIDDMALLVKLDEIESKLEKLKRELFISALSQA